MAQTKQEILALLSQADTEPRHRFGQNFMIDQNLVRIVADAGLIVAGDVVIEVGPGTGTLTEELLQRASRVIAVEIDRDLAGMLRQTLAGNANFVLIEGDALSGKHALNPSLAEVIGQVRSAGAPVKLVANLPYNIASPLAIELLMAGVDLLAFTVQKEVADRLKAPAGGDDFGPLSVVAQLLARVEILRTLPPQAFWPAPKIDSALVRLTRVDRLGSTAHHFSIFVHKVFAYRRKTLRKAIAQAGYDPAIATNCRLDITLRPEQFSPDQWLAMYSALRAMSPEESAP